MPSKEYLERKSAYIKKYQKEKYKNISFKLRIGEDNDVLTILNSVENKSEFLKLLVRNSIKGDR